MNTPVKYINYLNNSVLNIFSVVISGVLPIIGHDRLSLLHKLSNLGHYARKGANAVLKPVSLAVATLSIIAASYGDIQAQSIKEVKPETISVSGKAYNPGNYKQGIPGATVSMHIPSLDTTMFAITNDKGEYTLSNIPNNTDVTFDAGGIKNKYSISGFDITVSNTNNNVNFILPDKYKVQTITDNLVRNYFKQTTMEGDTIWGTGLFLTKNAETTFSVGNILLYLTPEQMAMVTPDTTYEFITDNNGIAPFNNPGLPVYIDSTTGINDLLTKKTQVFPTFGSEMNAFFPDIQRGTIQVYDMGGRLVKQQEFHSDHEYLRFDNLTSGMYVYNIQTEQGVSLGGKFVKQNVPVTGPSARPTNSTFKDTQTHEATYWAKWIDPEFLTDSTIVTIEEGENNPIALYMTPFHPYVIDNQDISGTVHDLNNNYAGISNATVEVYIPSTNTTLTTTSDSNGDFVINGIPLDTEILFSAGDVSGKYSILDVEYTTIDEVINPADSVNPHFSVLLGDKVSTTTALHIRQQNANGTNQDTVWYDFTSNVPEFMKPGHRANFAFLQAEEDNKHVYMESTVPLTDYGITIDLDSYATNPIFEGTVTPLGNVLYPVKRAEVDLPGATDPVKSVHEYKRATGYDEVAWTGEESVMEANPQAYTTQDKDIAKEYSIDYWTGVYQDGKSWIDIDHTHEDFSERSSLTARRHDEAFR